MLGFIKGKVIFSDGQDVIILTTSGIGYEVSFNKLLAEGADAQVFTTHIQREDAQTLYGFETLKDKKFFELLLQVKGVGPKSAYSLASTLGHEQIVQAILYEDVKTLQKAPGIGKKAAAQILLDLKTKVEKLAIWDDLKIEKQTENHKTQSPQPIVSEAVLALETLGFDEFKIVSLAKKIIAENKNINKTEQLVEAILKQI